MACLFSFTLAFHYVLAFINAVLCVQGFFFFFTGCINYIVFVVSGKTGVLPAYKMVSGDGSSCHEPLKSTKVLLVTGARTRDQVIGLRRREFVILRQPHSLEFCDRTSSRGNTLLRKHFNCSPLDVVAIALSRCL